MSWVRLLRQPSGADRSTECKGKLSGAATMSLIASAARSPWPSGRGRKRLSFRVCVAIATLERLALAHVEALAGRTRRLDRTGSRRPHRQSAHGDAGLPAPGTEAPSQGAKVNTPPKRLLAQCQGTGQQ